MRTDKLTKYETHRLIKKEIPTARTAYEREHRGQITIDEYLDEQDNQFNQRSIFLGGL